MRISEEKLRNLIRGVLLTEKTRYEKETGKKFDLAEEIEKYVSEGPLVTHAFTMTSIPKVGVNPKSGYKNPIGIYSYPLDRDHFEMLVRDELPFMSDAPYFSVMKIRDLESPKWLKFTPDGRDWASAGTLYKAFSQASSASLEKARDFGKHWKMNRDAKIYDLTFFQVYSLRQDSDDDEEFLRPKKKTQRSNITWTEILRNLGFSGIYDYGMSVLHPNEPTQLVFLDQSSWSSVGTYKTQDLRKQFNKQYTRDKYIVFGGLKTSESEIRRIFEDLKNSSEYYFYFLDSKQTPEDIKSFIINKIIDDAEKEKDYYKKIELLSPFLKYLKTPSVTTLKSLLSLPGYIPFEALSDLHNNNKEWHWNEEVVDILVDDMKKTGRNWSLLFANNKDAPIDVLEKLLGILPPADEVQLLSLIAFYRMSDPGASKIVFDWLQKCLDAGDDSSIRAGRQIVGYAKKSVKKLDDKKKLQYFAKEFEMK